MQLRDEQFHAIEDLFPKPRGNIKIDNRTIVKAYLQMLKEGYSWRSMPTRYGNRHTIYARWNRWSTKGVWEKVFTGFKRRGQRRPRRERAVSTAPW